MLSRFVSAHSKCKYGTKLHPQLVRASASASAFSSSSWKSSNTCDVIIIGSGVMGLNTAYQIARRLPSARIKLFERAADVGHGSSGASSAILRAFYTLRPMIHFANTGMHLYKHWADYLRIPVAAQELRQQCAKFTQTGLLNYMPIEKKDADETKQKFDDCGIAMSVLGADELQSRFPQINHNIGVFDNEGRTDFVDEWMREGRTYMMMEEGAGYFEPVQAMVDLKTALRSPPFSAAGNVALHYNTPIRAVNHRSGKVSGVTTAQGDVYESEYVVNCNGPWFHRIVDQMDGLDIKFTVNPVRIQTIYKDAPELFGHGDDTKDVVPFPIINDVLSGVYMRPQLRSKQVLVSTTAEEEERDYVSNPDELPAGVDPDNRNKYLNSLYHRLSPILEPKSSKVQGISGMYTICEDDVHYIIGETKLKGFVVCTGFSGHGFKSAPAVGSLIAQQLTNIKIEGDTDVDPEFFSPYREPHHMLVKNVFA